METFPCYIRLCMDRWSIAIDIDNWKLYATVLATFWTVVAVFVYLPLLVKKLTKKQVKVKDEDVHLHSDSGYSEEHIKQMQDPRHNQWGVHGEPKRQTKKKQLDEDAIRKAGW